MPDQRTPPLFRGFFIAQNPGKKMFAAEYRRDAEIIAQRFSSPDKPSLPTRKEMDPHFAKYGRLFLVALQEIAKRDGTLIECIQTLSQARWEAFLTPYAKEARGDYDQILATEPLQEARHYMNQSRNTPAKIPEKGMPSARKQLPVRRKSNSLTMSAA